MGQIIVQQAHNDELKQNDVKIVINVDNNWVKYLWQKV